MYLSVLKTLCRLSECTTYTEHCINSVYENLTIVHYRKIDVVNSIFAI